MRPSRPRRPSLVGTPVLLAGALALGGCDLPTELPRWDTAWDVVLAADTISTAELLPDELGLTDEGFVLEDFQSESTVALGDVCELCTCFDGPIPPLEIAPTDWELRLPPRVLAVRVLRGSAELVLHNEMAFDILDDGEGGRGFLQVELVDTRTDEVFETVRFDDPLPPGDSVRLDFDLPSLDLTPRVVARVRGETPGSGCDDVELDPEDGFRARVRLRNVVARDALVILSDESVAPPGRTVELPGGLADRLRPDDAELAAEVEVGSRLPAAVDVELSAAADPDDLYTARAALFTPLVLPMGGVDAPAEVRKTFLMELDRLEGAESLRLEGRSRITTSRIVRLRGGESVTYRVRLRARIPNR